MAKKAKRMRAYRLPDETISKIERMARAWECTQAEVIERGIDTLRVLAENEPLPTFRTTKEAMQYAPDVPAVIPVTNAHRFKGPLLKPSAKKKSE